MTAIHHKHTRLTPVPRGWLDPYGSMEETQAAFASHVSRGKVALYEELGVDLAMGARTGARFQDAFSDRVWFDCHGNGGVFNLGHRHPRVLGAVQEALGRLDIGNHHLVSGHRARLAERLAATTDGRLSGVVFGVSGGEAVDVAIKVVRARTGRRRIVSVAGGYHGHTGLALAAGDPRYRNPFGPNLPGFVQVPFNDLDALTRALDQEATAGVLLEPIPATLGMPMASPGYLRGIQTLCRRAGAQVILDEVQTGLGRTGAIWCHQNDVLEPDVVVVGKGLSGGIYPITATLMTRDLHRLFDERPFVHISTFGGAEPGCAAAMAVLDIIEAPGFLARVRALSDRFAEGFGGLPFTLRQKGLMMGLAFPDETDGPRASRRLYEAGIFAVYANHDPAVVQFLPPLVSTDEDVDEIIRRVRGCFR